MASERQVQVKCAGSRICYGGGRAGEPIAYIIGKKWFYDLELMVTRAVLIPRPETELLLEEALSLTAESPHCQAVDIGTGSGALALAFARHRPGARVIATDICPDALKVARQNARLHDLTLEFLHGDLARPLIKRGLKVDLLMANLPYIASDELARLEVSQYEPQRALDGGRDGLCCIRRLLPQLPQVCRGGAMALLEIGAGQGREVAALVREALSLPCDILPDYAGLDRIARFQFPPEA